MPRSPAPLAGRRQRSSKCSPFSRAVFSALTPGVPSIPDAAASLPGPLADFQSELSSYSMQAPGHIALAVSDLATGLTTGVNAGSEMPAASTIKVPVMVEVFRQLSAGGFDLNTRLRVSRADKDWGSGDLCDARLGSSYTVSRLLSLMIDASDNTVAGKMRCCSRSPKSNVSLLEMPADGSWMR